MPDNASNHHPTATQASELNPWTLTAESVLELPDRTLDYMLEIVAFGGNAVDDDGVLLFVNPADPTPYNAGDVPEYSRMWSHARLLFAALHKAEMMALAAQHPTGQWSVHVYEASAPDDLVVDAMADDMPAAAATAILQAMLPAWKAGQEARPS